MTSSRSDEASTDLSAARWRAARIRTATSNLVAPFGLRPSSGQLSGHGGDRLHSAIHRGEFPADGAPSADVAIGERGPLLALLDWAKHRGVKTEQLHRALSPRATPQPVPLATFRELITDIERECVASGEAGWGLFAGEQQPVRVLLPTDPATTLLAAPTAAVGISGDGLQLLRRHITLTGWRSTGRGLLLTTPAGERHLGPAALDTRLLRCIGRDAPQIELRRVPLSELLAPVLGTLTEFITAQLGSAENLFVTTS